MRAKPRPSDREHPALDDERDDCVQPNARLQIGHHERSFATHARRVVRHHCERCADVRREVGLVDDEQVRLRDAGAALPRDFLAARDVDDV